MNVPAWMMRREDGVFVVDPDAAYATILEALGVKDSDVDQYWIGVAYFCVRSAIYEVWSAETPSVPLQIHIRGDGGRRERWGLHAHRRRDPPSSADAQEHYLRIRAKIFA